MQYINSPQYAGIPMDPYGYQSPGNTQNPYGFTQQAPQILQNQQAQIKQIDPRVFETPEITMGETKKSLFTVTDSKEANTITVDNSSDAENVEKKKRRGRPSKSESTNNTPIVRANSNPEQVSGTVENPATIYTYQETNGLLHETLGQIDAINVELVQEFNAVRHNRTMKNKYMVLNNLSENIGAMLSNRIATIKEINNCITKSNDMDYKRNKDLQAAQATMNDDKYIADLYQAFIANPQNQAPQMQIPQVDPAVMGSGIVRANVTSDAALSGGNITDAGYFNYLANLTPEQNMMRYENDPNVKQVVVYDASSGAKFFQIMNMVTGEAINNVPTYDAMIMEDTTLDLKTKIAKNINLNESFPIIVINDNITSQY